MSDIFGKFMRLKPSQLVLGMFLQHNEETASPVASLKAQMVEFGGLLEPFVVRALDDKSYLVLGGEWRLRTIWELQNEGNDDLFRWVPCYVVPSDGPVTDLKIYTILKGKGGGGLSAEDYDRLFAAIAAAEKKKSKRSA